MKSLRKVVEAIRPGPDELLSVKKTAGEILSALKKSTDKEVLLLGSVAKGTFLSGESDLDVFILFDKRADKPSMKSELEKIFRKAFPGENYQMNYAEHPYIKFRFKGLKVDVVPAYKMKKADERLTAVDRSVLHTRFILKNMNKKQKDEVRLLKKLLKASGIYGAEIRVEGFSGYLCELLVIRYKSFMGVMKAAAGLKLPAVIDIKKYYKKPEHPNLVKNFGRKLIVIDPTDKNRNVAAALSEKNLGKFIKLAKLFVKKPAGSYFFRHDDFDKKVSRLGKKNNVVILRFKRSEAVDDVLWGQLKRFNRLLDSQLSDFDVKEIFAESNGEVRIAVVSGKKISGGLVEKQGPPLEMKENVEKFRKKHRGRKIIKRKNRLVAFVKTPKTSIKDAIRNFISANHKKFNHLNLKNAFIE